MRKNLLILCTVFFAMVFISCNNEDKNIPSKPTETDWEEIEESCTEAISGVEEFDFSVGEWEYYSYMDYDYKLAGGDRGYFFTEIKKEKILIEEIDTEKRIYKKDFQYEEKYVIFPATFYEEMKSSFEEEYPSGIEVKLEYDDETNTVIRILYSTTYTEEYSYADFIDDFSRKNGMDKYITNEDKSVLMLEEGSPEFETNDGAHHKWTKKEFYVKK